MGAATGHRPGHRLRTGTAPGRRHADRPGPEHRGHTRGRRGVVARPVPALGRGGGHAVPLTILRGNPRDTGHSHFHDDRAGGPGHRARWCCAGARAIHRTGGGRGARRCLISRPLVQPTTWRSFSGFCRAAGSGIAGGGGCRTPTCLP